MPMKTIDVGTLKEWMARGDVVVVDVREPEENAAERIEKAVAKPMAKMPWNYKNYQ